MKNQRHKILL